MPDPKRNPGAVSCTGALKNDRQDHKRSVGRVSSGPEAVNDSEAETGPEYGIFGESPTHPDAEALWPILYPVYVALIAARFDLEARYPRLAKLLGRIAEALLEQMMDAELGLLNAHPERRVAHDEKSRAAR